MNAPRFAGKNVVVTGAGQGIGRAIANRFASEGADVMLIGRRPGPLAETAAEIEAAGGTSWTELADISRSDDVVRAVSAAKDRWGRIDVLVNNAGIAEERPFLEIEDDGWDAVIATNLRGTFLMARDVAREQVKTGGGSIVHIAS